jgi:tRNA modification GTPase
MHVDHRDTIVAPATAPGAAAIAVLRLSGPDAIRIAEKFFHSRSLKKKSLAGKAGNTVHFGFIVEKNVVIDEVLITLFRAPHSYTGEDTVEVSCHGSVYIQQKLLSMFLSSGARAAGPGEFTLRAFLAGKMDLSQAEAVADLVASTSSVSHEVAMKQMRGGFSAKIRQLREQLVQFAALVELELDFSEEDVEFADRSKLSMLINEIDAVIAKLIESFQFGNVIRNGIPVVIAGRPNAGKSTLLNALLQEERAIVSEVPGTTRDTIEDHIVIEGVQFRFIDTAGLRETTDKIEQIGVSRAKEAMEKAAAVLYIFDAHDMSAGEVASELHDIRQHVANAEVIVVANKSDLENEEALRDEFADLGQVVFISAKEHTGLEGLKERLLSFYFSKADAAVDTVVTNARHARSLELAGQALDRVQGGLDNKVPGDLLTQDIRTALNELGLITGQVTGDDLLQHIFSKFCIGK